MEQDYCFIIMPFSEEFNGVYQCISRAIQDNFNFNSKRADDIHSPGNLHDQIITEIRNAKFIIADITSANPNVLYELGVSRGFNVPRIIICQSLDEVPSDLKGERIKIYQNRIGAENEVIELIVESINVLFPQSIREDRKKVKAIPELGKNLEIINTSKYVGDGRFDWEIHLEGPDDELNEVESVIYYLHPTFPKPIRRKNNRDKNFQLKSNGWGEFIVKVQIHYRSDELETRKYLLTLDEN